MIAKIKISALSIKEVQGNALFAAWEKYEVYHNGSGHFVFHNITTGQLVEFEYVGEKLEPSPELMKSWLSQVRGVIPGF